MATKSFKDLIVWQKTQDTILSIYADFRKCNDFAFRDQIQRAAMSISNNIAEGYARRSDKALKNFLFIALGSAAEVESMLLVSVKLGYISESNCSARLAQIEEVEKLINGLIRKL